MMILLSNVLGFFSGSFCLASTFMKTKNKILTMQCIDMVCNILSCLLLKGFSGAVVTSVSLFRDLICRDRKVSKRFMVVIMIITFVLTIAVNNNGIYGMIPVAAAVGYAWVVMTHHDASEILAGLIYNNFLWMLYKIIIGNYAGTFMNIVIIGFSIYNIIKAYRNRSIHDI